MGFARRNIRAKSSDATRGCGSSFLGVTSRLVVELVVFTERHVYFSAAIESYRLMNPVDQFCFVEALLG